MKKLTKKQIKEIKKVLENQTGLTYFFKHGSREFKTLY